MKALAKYHFKHVRNLYLQTQHRASFRRRSIFSKIISLKYVKSIYSQHIFISTQILLIKCLSKHIQKAVVAWNTIKNTKIWKYVCNKKLKVLDLDATKPALRWIQLSRRNLEKLNIRFSSCTSFFSKSDKLFNTLGKFKALRSCDFTPNNLSLFSLSKPLAQFIAHNDINFKVSLINVEPSAIWKITEALSKQEFDPDKFFLSLNSQTTIKNILSDIGQEPEYFIKDLNISTRVGINLKDCSLFYNIGNFLCLRTLKMTIGFDLIYQENNFDDFVRCLALPPALKKFTLLLTDSWVKPQSTFSRLKEDQETQFNFLSQTLDTIEENPIFGSLANNLYDLSELEDVDISFISPQNIENYHLLIYTCGKKIPNLKSLSYSIAESCAKSFNVYLFLSLLRAPSALDKLSINCFEFSGVATDLQKLPNLTDMKLTSKVHNSSLSLIVLFNSLSLRKLTKLIVNDGLNLECLSILYDNKMELKLQEIFLDISKVEITDSEFLKFLDISICTPTIENFQLCAIKCRAYPELIYFLRNNVMTKRNLRALYIVLQNHTIEKSS